VTANLYDLAGRTAVVTGGTGVLGSAMAAALAHAGARVAILGRRTDAAERVAQQLTRNGATAMALPADVLAEDSLQDAVAQLESTWGPADVLLNAAGGNRPDALVHGEKTLFDMPADAFRAVLDLNLTGTLLPIQAFGRAMAETGRGSIINISSMAARKPLTRVIGYAAAKAGVDNLTQWLAVHAAQTWGEGVRVNAIAPGFFVGEQNRALLLNDDGTPTERGARILDHTPMGRFGNPSDLSGTAVWLASDASAFVTGIVVPVDGGYDAYGGV
jgi:NAD(P)-dependent dehydrogenase (short-subunit alcohol dehydrogenase family)